MATAKACQRMRRLRFPGGGLSTLVIAGTASGAILLLCALLFCLFVIQRRRRRRHQRDVLGLSAPASAVNALTITPGCGVENPLAKYRRESVTARATDMATYNRTSSTLSRRVIQREFIATLPSETLLIPRETVTTPALASAAFVLEVGAVELLSVDACSWRSCTSRKVAALNSARRTSSRGAVTTDLLPREDKLNDRVQQSQR